MGLAVKLVKEMLQDPAVMKEDWEETQSSIGERARRRRLEASADPEDWMRIQSCAGIWASVWLTVTPTENGLSFLDVEYAVLVRFRLRLPLQQEGAPCARLRRPPSNSAQLRMGGSWYDPEGDHAHSCQWNSGL